MAYVIERSVIDFIPTENGEHLMYCGPHGMDKKMSVFRSPDELVEAVKMRENRGRILSYDECCYAGVCSTMSEYLSYTGINAQVGVAIERHIPIAVALTEDAAKEYIEKSGNDTLSYSANIPVLEEILPKEILPKENVSAETVSEAAEWVMVENNTEFDGIDMYRIVGDHDTVKATVDHQANLWATGYFTGGLCAEEIVTDVERDDRYDVVVCFGDYNVEITAKAVKAIAEYPLEEGGEE